MARTPDPTLRALWRDRIRLRLKLGNGWKLGRDPWRAGGTCLTSSRWAESCGGSDAPSHRSDAGAHHQLPNMSHSVKLTNASGKLHISKKIQYPYLRIDVGDTGLLSGSIGPKQLTFRHRPKNFSFVVSAGPGAP